MIRRAKTKACARFHRFLISHIFNTRVANEGPSKHNRAALTKRRRCCTLSIRIEAAETDERCPQPVWSSKLRPPDDLLTACYNSMYAVHQRQVTSAGSKRGDVASLHNVFGPAFEFGVSGQLASMCFRVHGTKNL